MSVIFALIVSVAAITALGVPVSTCLSVRRSTRMAAAPVFGTAVVVILCSALYPIGVPLALIAVGLGLSACCVVSWYSYQAFQRRLLSRSALVEYLPLLAYGAFLVLVTLVASPNWSVFQGNHWDHLTYESSAIAYASHSYSTVLTTTPAGALSNPLLLIAEATIKQRPAVMYAYALFSNIPAFSLYRDGYVFLLACDFLIFSSVYFVARNFISKSSRAHILLPSAIAVAAAAGFYGQLAFDINAWSAFLATPMLTVGAWCVVTQFLRRPEKTQTSIREPLIVGMLLAAAFVVYPEGAAVFGASLVLTGLAAFILRPGLRSWGFPYSLWTCGSATITVLVCQGQSLIEFLASQYQSPSGQAPTWWMYFDQFMFGYDPRFLDAISRGISPNAAATSFGISLPHYILSASDALLIGIFGAFFLNDSPFGEVNLSVVLSLVTASVWLIGIGVWLFRMLKSTKKSRHLSFVLFLVIFLTLNLSFVIRHEYWAAGKILLWISPLLVVALCSPLLLYRSNSRAPRILVPIPLVWLLLQLG
ncbi:MAG: hypothetical protein WCK17_09490, partial [Verrucomicrobiota bacterium]